MDGLTVGDRVRAADKITLEGMDTTIKVNEEGEVVRIDPTTGEVDVRMDKQHAGLAQFQNCLPLNDASEEEGIIDRLEVRMPDGSWRRLRSRTPHTGILTNIELLPVPILVAAE